MALITTQGIVFRKINYGETSVIFDAYTPDHGLHSFIAGSVRSPKSRMPASLFQPMMPVELVVYLRENAADHLHRIKEARLLFPMQGIPFDFKKGAVALFYAEICCQTIKETAPDPELFDFLIQNILFLDKAEGQIGHLHLHFLVHLCTHLGFTPAWPEGGGAVFFDLREGTATSVRPPHHDYFSGDSVQHLRRLSEIALEDAIHLDMNIAERRILLQHLLAFFRFHSPGFKEIHTPGILDQVFR